MEEIIHAAKELGINQKFSLLPKLQNSILIINGA